MAGADSKSRREALAAPLLALAAPQAQASSQPPAATQAAAGDFASLTASFRLALADEPSGVVDVAFGEQHEEAMERERQRTREVIEGLSGPSIAVALEALNKP